MSDDAPRPRDMNDPTNEGPMGVFSSLFTRVREYIGPRILSTGTSSQDGYSRQASAPPVSQTRWILADLEAAIMSADSGNMKIPGRLVRSLRRDGYIVGVLATRFDGLVQLPLKISSDDPEIAATLTKEFRAVFPSSELALLAGDGRMLGVGVAEFVQIPGELPVLKRLDPEYLQYRWAEDRWYFQGIHGVEPVNPGDGRWVLHCPGGAVQPWSHGLWPSLARAYIAKEHAYYLRENYSFKLANAARVAISPQGATQALRALLFSKLAAWGPNPVFDLPPGWDIKLIESNGTGYQVFQETIKTCNEEIIVILAGQTVTTTGGAGFQNANIFSTIRTDLIQAEAEAIAFTLATQAIPVWAAERFGNEAARANTRASWDVTPPKDLESVSRAMLGAANAVKALNEALAPYGKQVDVEEVARRFDVPAKDLAAVVAQAEKPALEPGPGIVKSIDARAQHTRIRQLENAERVLEPKRRAA